MNISVLTGAGISGENGLGTFCDEDGLWTRYRIEDVATPQDRESGRVGQKRPFMTGLLHPEVQKPEKTMSRAPRIS